MVFSSIPFLYYFLPITLLCYLVVPKQGKNTVIFIASMVFYAWGERLLVLLFALSIFVSWAIAMLIDKSGSLKLRRTLLIISIVYDLGILFYFKYSDFFIWNINKLTGIGLPMLKVALPIGISFYTFQLISYTVDVYKRQTVAEKNLIDFAAYISMFPQLIAGPIVRYVDIKDRLKEKELRLDEVAYGIERFVIGLSKKVLIANSMGELCLKFRGEPEPSVLFYWMYAVAFMLQIYYDFSGYSDMAIGLGHMLGFEFMENFNYPYTATTITDFWRRWHISLSSWFRDYVYIPLGGNRKGKSRQLVNILIVFTLTGLWHGAAWNFVLWGTLYAVLLIIEKLGLKSWLEKHSFIGHIYVCILVMLGFVLFNAGSLAQAFNDMAGMFAFGTKPIISTSSIYYLKSYAILYLLGILGATPLIKALLSKLKGTAFEIIKPVAIGCLLLVSTAFLIDGSFNPFLYFRF